MKTIIKKIVVSLILLSGFIVPAIVLAQEGSNMVDIYFKPNSDNASIIDPKGIVFPGFTTNHAFRIEIQPSDKVPNQEHVRGVGTSIARVRKGGYAKIMLFVEEGKQNIKRTLLKSYDLGTFKERFAKTIGENVFVQDTYDIDISCEPITVQVKDEQGTVIGSRESYVIELKVESQDEDDDDNILFQSIFDENEEM